MTPPLRSKGYASGSWQTTSMLLETERPLLDNRYAKRFECLEEERFARCVVADSEYDMVKHELS